MRVSGGQNELLSFKQSRENNLFENKKEPYQWVFPKAVFALCLS